jgi:hypothetical protein
MIEWNDNMGVRGFQSERSAQNHIDRVCMAVAPNIEYTIEPEF